MNIDSMHMEYTYHNNSWRSTYMYMYNNFSENKLHENIQSDFNQYNSTSVN